MPTIASKGPVYEAHRGHGLALAGSDEEWERALENLLSPSFRSAAGAAARAYIDRHGFADQRVAHLLAEVAARAAA